MFSAAQPHHRARCTFQFPIDAQGVVGQRARKGKVNLQVFTSQHPEKWLVLPTQKMIRGSLPQPKMSAGIIITFVGINYLYLYTNIYIRILIIYIYNHIIYIYTFDNANCRNLCRVQCWVLLTHPLMNCVLACANSKKYGIPQGQNHYMNHHWSPLTIY